MKRVIATAFGLICLAGCNFGKSPEDQGLCPADRGEFAAQENPGPEQAGDTSLPSSAASRRKGKKKPIAQPPEAQSLDDLPPASGTENLAFDAGIVPTGQVLTHIFRVKNRSSEALAVKNDADIQTNCGCSSIVPAARVLEPAAEADVTVTIRTGSLRRNKGPFAHGGKILWTSESGHLHVTSLTLRGEAIAPLAGAPELLVFTPDEVNRGVTKELVFAANVPIDWSAWTVVSSSPYFQIVDPAQPAEGEKASCKVKCLPPECLQDLRAEIVVKAHARRSGSDSFAVSLAIPVRARQVVDLSITPQVVPVTFGPSTDRTTVKLMFRGDKAAKGEILIESIDYEGCVTSWKLSKGADPQVAVLEVNLLRQPGKPNGTEKNQSEKEPELVIHMARMKSVRLPVVEVGPSLDAP